MTTTIEEYWVNLRLGRQRSQPSPLYPDLTRTSALAPLISWSRNLHRTTRDTFRVLPGENRDIALRKVQDELPQDTLFQVSPFTGSDDPVSQVTLAVRDMKVPSGHRAYPNFTFLPPHPAENPFGWDLLWCLVACHEVVVPEQLSGHISRKSSRSSDFYRALIEVRFEAQEKQFFPAIEESVVSLSRWIEGNYKQEDGPLDGFLQKAGIRSQVQPDERFDLLLFILSLAKHNHLLDEFVFYIDGLETLTKEHSDQLLKILGALDRWTLYGCPLNLLLGWRGTREDQRALRSRHARLSARVKEGLGWVQS